MRFNGNHLQNCNDGNSRKVAVPFFKEVNCENLRPNSYNVCNTNEFESPTADDMCVLLHDHQFEHTFNELEKISAALKKVTAIEKKLNSKSSEYLASRDDEVHQISKWITNSLEHGSNGVLHLFGESGVGKTCVARHVVRTFLTNPDYQRKLSSEMIYLTCNHMSNCVQLYDELLKLILGSKDLRKLKSFKPVYEHGGLTEVKQRFSQELSKRAKYSICILDEVDFLIKSGNKNMRAGEDLLRSIFDVASDSNCRLLLIVISNSMNTIECDKAVQKTTLSFPAYTAAQLRDIVEKRIGMTSKDLEHIFPTPAVELCLRQSAKTGDCRNCYFNLSTLLSKGRRKLEQLRLNDNGSLGILYDKSAATLNHCLRSSNENKETLGVNSGALRGDVPTVGDKKFRKSKKRGHPSSRSNSAENRAQKNGFLSGVKRPCNAKDLDPQVVSLGTLGLQGNVKGILATPTEERSNASTFCKDKNSATPYSTFTESTIAPSASASPFATPSSRKEELLQELEFFEVNRRFSAASTSEVAEINGRNRIFGQELSPQQLQTMTFPQDRDIELPILTQKHKENIAPAAVPIIRDSNALLLTVDNEIQQLLELSVMRQMVLYAVLSWGIQQCKALNISANKQDIFLRDCRLSSSKVVDLLQKIFHANQGAELLRMIKNDGSFLMSALETFQDSKILKIHGNSSRMPNQNFIARRSDRQPAPSRTSKNGNIVIEFTIPLAKMQHACAILAKKVQSINCFEHFSRGHE